MLKQAGNGKGPDDRDGDDRALLSYLAKLGLDDVEMAKAVSMLQAMHGEELTVKPSRVAVEETPRPIREKHTEKRLVKVYLAEEQKILRGAYQSFFTAHPTIELQGVSADTSGESIVAAAKAFRPDVILLGVKTLEPATVERLEMLRRECRQVAPALFFAFYEPQGIRALREFSKDATSGGAYLLKHTIDTVDQLTQVIHEVSQGRIIVDPMVMGGLIDTGDLRSLVLKRLSTRELEVLSWMAKGYRDQTIADVLSRDVGAVERDIKKIYGKLHQETHPDAMDRRVQASMMYLKATGMLPTADLVGD